MEPEPRDVESGSDVEETSPQPDVAIEQKQVLAGMPAPHTTTTPTEYTPTFLVSAYEVILNFIATELGNHIYNVLQEMRQDAETYGKRHKEKPKHILSKLLDEVPEWRHIPVAKGDSTTILDQEVDAVRSGVPNLMNAVEDALRNGAIFLSGGRGATAEGITVKVPPIRDFVHNVFVRVAREYTGRNGPSRLYRHLTRNKDKLIREVKVAVSAALFPRETVWGTQDDVEKTISVPAPGQPDPQQPSGPARQKTIALGGQGATPEPANALDKDGEFKNEELEEGGSESGSESGDGF